MATIQCPKRIEQTSTVSQKTTTETCHSKGNQEHSFTDKMKEVVHSATKIFEHKNQENSGEHCHLNQKPHGMGMAKTRTHETHCLGTTHKKEGHGGNFITNIGDHIKNMTSKKKHRKNKGGNCNESGSDSSSSSSDESDNETCKKQDCV